MRSDFVSTGRTLDRGHDSSPRKKKKPTNLKIQIYPKSNIFGRNFSKSD